MNKHAKAGPNYTELKKAFEKDVNQYFVNSITPDRGYPVPVDNILKYIESAIASDRSEMEQKLRELVSRWEGPVLDQYTRALNDCAQQLEQILK
jgi:hypothetical protein